MARAYQKREFCDEKCILWIIFSKQFISAQICKDRCIYTAYDFHDWLQENGFVIIKQVTIKDLVK